MLPNRFVITNVELWTSKGVAQHSHLLIESGVIKKIISGTKELPKEFADADTIWNGNGVALLPAGVDAQTHLRTPGQPEKETPLTGLKAALRGGYAAVLTMPNTKPVIDSPSSVALAQAQLLDAENKTGVRALISAAMTTGQDGRDVVDAVALKSAGVVALTDDGKGVAQDAVMDQVFEQAERSGLPILQHAEVPGHGGILAPGPTQKKLGLRSYPARAESDMVRRDCDLAMKHPKARYHVLHVSAVESLDVIREFKSMLPRLTAEVTPHHLFFSSDDIPENDTSFKMNPPIRGPRDRDALIEGLASGLLDFVSTDHAPHEPARKGTDFEASAFGTTGLETTLRVLWDLVLKDRLTIPRLVEVCSTKPSEFLGLGDSVGQLVVGRPLFAVAFDHRAPARTLDVSELESLSKNNCFLGSKLPGRIVASFNQAGLFQF